MIPSLISEKRRERINICNRPTHFTKNRVNKLSTLVVKTPSRLSGRRV